MNNCNFVCEFPDYVLDRTIKIADGHQHRISSYKLAKFSNYFREMLKQIRSQEIEKWKATQKLNVNGKKDGVKGATRDSNPEKKTFSNVIDLVFSHIFVDYDDTEALEYVLSFIHCKNNLDLPQLKLSTRNIISIIKAGYYFQVPALVNHCSDHVKNNLNFDNCWIYYKLGDQILFLDKNIYGLINSFILEHFMTVSSFEGFLNIPCNKLNILLRSDSLNCKNEILLVAIIRRWINHKKLKRLSHHRDLMKLVRLGLLNKKQIDQLEITMQKESSWNDSIYLITWSQLNACEMNKLSGDIKEETVNTVQYMNKPRFPREAIIIIGGWEGNQTDGFYGPSTALQIYDNRSNEWTRIEEDYRSLDEGHAYAGCVIMGSKIYIVGGFVFIGPTQILKMFDLKTFKWKYLSPMHEKRNYVSAASLDGMIYAIGGHNGRIRLRTVERYDPENNTWTFVCSMNRVRSDTASASVNNKLYVCGGYDGLVFFSSMEMYDPETDQWTEISQMNWIRSGACLLAYGGYLYAIGGNDGVQRLSSVERLNLQTGNWHSMPSMNQPRSHFCVAALEGEIYAMGGLGDETNCTIAHVEKWRPSLLSEWKQVKDLTLTACANFCCSFSGLKTIQEMLSN